MLIKGNLQHLNFTLWSEHTQLKNNKNLQQRQQESDSGLQIPSMTSLQLSQSCYVVARRRLYISQLTSSDSSINSSSCCLPLDILASWSAKCCLHSYRYQQILHNDSTHDASTKILTTDCLLPTSHKYIYVHITLAWGARHTLLSPF